MLIHLRSTNRAYHRSHDSSFIPAEYSRARGASSSPSRSVPSGICPPCPPPLGRADSLPYQRSCTPTKSSHPRKCTPTLTRVALAAGPECLSFRQTVQPTRPLRRPPCECIPSGNYPIHVSTVLSIRGCTPEKRSPAHLLDSFSPRIPDP